MTSQVNRATLVQRYEEGETLRALAQAYGTTRYYVTLAFDQMGYSRRSRGTQKRGDRWATHWKKCRACGETKRKHHSHGLCTSDYYRWRWVGRPKIWNGIAII